MRSTITIITGPTSTRLTTVERVRLELSKTTNEDDALIQAKIDEASASIEAYLGRVLSRATLTESFFDDRGWGWPGHYRAEGGLVLTRFPVSQLSGFFIEDSEITDYRLDADAGIIYRGTEGSSAYLWPWTGRGSVDVTYTAGYALPGEQNRNLPHNIESAAVDLAVSLYLSRGRDPTVMSEDVPGLGGVRYWVGAIGKDELPPTVISKLSGVPRRMALA